MLDLPQMNFNLEVMDSGQLAKNDWHPGKTETKRLLFTITSSLSPPFPQTRYVPAVVFGDDISKWFVWGTPFASSNCPGAKHGGFELWLY